MAADLAIAWMFWVVMRLPSLVELAATSSRTKLPPVPEELVVAAQPSLAEQAPPGEPLVVDGVS